MSNKTYICPKCGNPLIKETVVPDYAFVCWFCDENFYSFEAVAVERELSGNRVRGELRKHLGQFIKRLSIDGQIKILQKAVFEYENYCRQRKLKTYSAKGLSDFIRSVRSWNDFFDRIAENPQTAIWSN